MTIRFIMVNDYKNNPSGYDNAAGYGNPEPGYGGSDLESGDGLSGFEDTPDHGTPNMALGAGNHPWRTRRFADGYRGNPFEVNPFDTPLTEIAANPIPQGYGYGSGATTALGTSVSQGCPAENEWPLLPKPQGVVNSKSSASTSGQPSLRPRRPRQRRYGDDLLML